MLKHLRVFPWRRGTSLWGWGWVLPCMLALGLAFSSPPSSATPPRPCPGPPLTFRSLAPQLWQVVAAEGDADADNRGQVSNLFVARTGTEVWLLGSGPSPAFGRRLACQVRALLGHPVTDIISPWPQPAAVLGVAGVASLARVRHWAHADVAAAMRQRCPQCLARVRQRLGAAAADLQGQPVRLPERRLQGEQGRLGPWHWWRLRRSAGQPVTVWQWQGVHTADEGRWALAPGLLWGSGVPDGRDADIATLAAATDRLAALPVSSPVGADLRWVGEQGAPLPAAAARAQGRYWTLLRQAVDRALEQGDPDTGTPPPIAGLESATADPRHALNWQRAYRQAESSLLQRSLR